MKRGDGTEEKNGERGVSAETQAGPELQRLCIDIQAFLEVPQDDRKRWKCSVYVCVYLCMCVGRTCMHRREKAGRDEICSMKPSLQLWQGGPISRVPRRRQGAWPGGQ